MYRFGSAAAHAHTHTHALESIGKRLSWLESGITGKQLACDCVCVLEDFPRFNVRIFVFLLATMTRAKRKYNYYYRPCGDIFTFKFVFSLGVISQCLQLLCDFLYWAKSRRNSQFSNADVAHQAFGLKSSATALQPREC